MPLTSFSEPPGTLDVTASLLTKVKQRLEEEEGAGWCLYLVERSDSCVGAGVGGSFRPQLEKVPG